VSINLGGELGVCVLLRHEDDGYWFHSFSLNFDFWLSHEEITSRLFE
jgi:hypothetical protein